MTRYAPPRIVARDRDPILSGSCYLVIHHSECQRLEPVGALARSAISALLHGLNRSTSVRHGSASLAYLNLRCPGQPFVLGVVMQREGLAIERSIALVHQCQQR